MKSRPCPGSDALHAETPSQHPLLETPRLGDARSIPALAPATAFGSAAIHALAAFGEAASGEVLDVVEDREGMYDAVGGGLTTLRFMIEAPKAGVLSEQTMHRVREAVRDRLTGHAGNVEFIVLWTAIDLAVILGNPDLLAIVRALADDEDELVKRGIAHPEVARRTKQRATDGLAGIPPKPRPPGGGLAALGQLLIVPASASRFGTSGA